MEVGGSAVEALQRSRLLLMPMCIDQDTEREGAGRDAGGSRQLGS